MEEKQTTHISFLCMCSNLQRMQQAPGPLDQNRSQPEHNTHQKCHYNARVPVTSVECSHSCVEVPFWKQQT